MPVLWIQHEQEQRWSPVPLNGEAVALPIDPEQQASAEVDRASAVLLPLSGGSDRFLIAGSDAAVWINGDPLVLGIRVLRDRDVIRVGAGECVVYSAEALPSVVSFDEQRQVPCARCKTDITAGFLAVRCPKCGAWHHQGGDLLCWTYTEKCAGCDQPTAMDGCYHWTPEGL
jgi:hypothetical protein